MTETQETNNALARGIQIGADLVVSALTMPAKAGAGTTIAVSDTTLNQGTSVAPSSVTRFYLSANALHDAGDLLLSGSHAVPQLSAGAGSSGSTALPIPSTIAAGFYYVLAKADADLIANADTDNTTPETVEGNNLLTRSIRIGPDLAVSASSPFSVVAGGTLSVSDTVTNVGGDAAASSTIRFYLSVNTSLDPADTLLAASRAVPSLGAGAWSSGATLVTIPTGTPPGHYVLLVHTDGDSAIIEAQETNNLAPRVPQVTTGSP